MTEKNSNPRPQINLGAAGQTVTDRTFAPAEVDLPRTDQHGTGSAGSDGKETVSETEFDLMIGIPAYNEAHAIASIVGAALTYADTVVVIDDGSQDDTSERAHLAGATVVTHERNQGYGGALRTLFDTALAADVDHLIILDGDGQHDANDIPKLLQAQRDTGAEIVIGSRFVDGANSKLPLYRRFGLVVVNTLTNLIMRLQYSRMGVSDTQSGFRAYDREAIKTIAGADDLGYGMDASLDILFHAARREYDIEEVPSTINYDIEDASTHNPIIHGLTLVWRIMLEGASPRNR